jgi:alkylation response protein AidB-like acyl-CoA dehydrogenase
VTALQTGRLDLDALHPFPAPDPAVAAAADALIEEAAELVGGLVDAERIDRTRELPAGLLDRLRDGGWFRVRNSAALGGREMSDYDAFRLVERISAVSLPVGQTLAIQNAVGAAALLAALPEGPLRGWVEERIAAGTVSGFAGTEPAGANNAWPGTTAVPTEDGTGYLLTGEKVFTGNGDIADLLAVLATAREDGHRRVGVFFLDTSDPGFRVRSRLEFMGGRGLPNAALTLDGLRVPREHVLLGEPDLPRFPPPVGSVALLSALFFNAAPALAIARQCLEWSHSFVARRSVNGRPLGDYDQVQRILATTAAEVFAMDTVVRWCLLDAGLEDRWFERAAAKNLVTVTAWRIVDRTVSLLGGEGFETAHSKERRGAVALPVERLFRDARGLRISGNVDFLLDVQAARLLLTGRYAAAAAAAAGAAPRVTTGGGAGAASAASGASGTASAASGAASGVAATDPGADLIPANQAHLAAARQGLRRFDRVSARLVARHQDPEELFARQETLRLLGRIAAELFSVAAVLARAATEGGDQQQELADVHCTAARHRLAGLWRRLGAPDEPDYAKISRLSAAAVS